MEKMGLEKQHINTAWDFPFCYIHCACVAKNLGYWIKTSFKVMILN